MTAPSLADVASAHETLAAHYRAQAASNDTIRPTASEWVAQKGSILGARRHIAAVRRLVSEGSSEARIVGRKYLLSLTALDAELGQVSNRRRVTSVPEPEPIDELAALRARYASATTSPKAVRL